MPTRMTLSFQGIGQAMKDVGIRAALASQAQQITSRARALNSAEGVTAEIGVEHGTNGRGRPYSRITSTAVTAEFGNSKTARRRVLGRAAEQGSYPRMPKVTIAFDRDLSRVGKTVEVSEAEARVRAHLRGSRPPRRHHRERAASACPRPHPQAPAGRGQGHRGRRACRTERWPAQRRGQRAGGWRAVVNVPPVLLMPDAEELLVAYLAERFPACTVVTELFMGFEQELPLLRVSRLGGAQVRPFVLDGPRLDIDVFHRSREQTSQPWEDNARPVDGRKIPFA